ncbi:hypothetical protein M422DRAFT_58802 [Sphaerobolus stellatus SS14]|nr:hypothetical protein M422DRAFT_58802 [Sphaerobolus stellatus SS14]
MDLITRELSTPPIKAPPLDPTLFQPGEVERDFLKASVSEDESEIRRRVLEAQAIELYPYPCIRAFHFVMLIMSQNPAYTKILDAIKDFPSNNPPIFLDLGCCMGTDVRKLAKDGYPAKAIIGCDLRKIFIEAGYKLYNDSPASLGINFIEGDIFAVPFSEADVPVSTKTPAEISSLGELQGGVTYIYTGALFHLFDEDTQFALALQLVRLLTREKGAIIFGRHQGKDQESLIDDHLGRVRYGHSPASWRRMWERAFTQLDGEHFVLGRLRVEANIFSPVYARSAAPGPHRQLTWSVHI